MRVMKRVSGALIGFLAIVISATPQVLPQAIVENPGKPLAKDAGRVLAVTEVWRINDQSEDETITIVKFRIVK
jgi:hypothetical protein